MTAKPAADVDSAQTHRVFNQVPDLAHYNLFDSDPALRAALDRVGGGWHADTLSRYGAQLGEPEVQAWAADAKSPHALVSRLSQMCCIGVMSSASKARNM